MDERKIIKLFYDKTALENASYYFEQSKKYSKKAEQAKKAIEKLKEKKVEEKEEKKKKQEVVQYPHFFTSSSSLYCVSGRNAEENEKLLREATDKDLMFHADIQGAGLVLLKNGLNASLEDKLDAACYAACYSKAWVNGYSSIDVYAFKKEQVYKEHQKAGSFYIKGEREWFKHTALRLKVAIINEKLFILPYRWKGKVDKEIELRPGNIDKNTAAKKLAEIFKVDEASIKALLPQGKFAILKDKNQ
jgi:predicted ribosome quality control (RQC) complex YloA/Tae2 family protein